MLGALIDVFYAAAEHNDQTVAHLIQTIETQSADLTPDEQFDFFMSLLTFTERKSYNRIYEDFFADSKRPIEDRIYMVKTDTLENLANMAKTNPERAQALFTVVNNALTIVRGMNARP